MAYKCVLTPYTLPPSCICCLEHPQKYLVVFITTHNLDGTDAVDLATELSWQCCVSKVANFQLLHLYFTYPTCIWHLHWGWPHLGLPRVSASEN